jgi:TonB-dependent receptor
MRRFSSLLWSTTALTAMIAVASPALAQDATAATPPDPNVKAQTSPAKPDGSPQTDDAVQTASGQDAQNAPGQAIVVTGLRRSLQSAQNIKRNSDQIVDAIVAEDIGKLPDVTASASLARITGVQVTRAAAEAANVQIRGIPDIITTYNSREIFTANDRFVAIQDFPAGSVAALEVFKAGTADLIEPGLGGEVNVRGRRPFDFGGLEVSGQLNAVRYTQRDKWNWNGNLLVSNRWAVGDGGEVGALVNIARTGIDFLDSTREQSHFMRTSNGVTFPDAAALYYGSGHRWRPSANFAFEYRPSPGARIYLDGLYQGYRGHDSNLYMLIPEWNTTISNIVTDSNGLVQSYSSTGGNTPDGFQEFHNAKTDTHQIGGGASYDMGSVLMSGDIAYTKSKYRDNQENVDFALASNPDRDVIVNAPNGGGGPGFTLLNFDAANGSNWLYRGLFDNRYRASGSGWQTRGDIDWRTGMSNLTHVQFGVRYNTRKARRDQGGRYMPGPRDQNGNLTEFLADTPAGGHPLPCGFDYDHVQGTTCLFGTDFNSVYDNLDALRTYAGQVTSPPDFDPMLSYHADEKALAGYGQVHLDFGSDSLPISTILGVRVVRTKDHLVGNLRNAASGVVTPVDRENTYTDVLPNANMRIQFARNLQGRLAFTITRSRPNFNDLSPSLTLNQPTGACQTEGPSSPNCFQTGFGGNPDLKPIKSRNYDATLEYYFGHQGAATFAVFHRDIKNFIFNSTQDVPGSPDVNFLRLSGPFNSGSGKISGFEAGLTTFFDNFGLPAWASGFGMQANYTYIDASTELAPNFQARLPGQQNFPGVSKHAYNLIGMYEKGPISARLAYNWRSKFVVEYDDFQGFQAPLMQKGLGQLDFSASYTPIENITIGFDALNILAGKSAIRTYRAFNAAGEVYPWNVKYLERVFSIGVRFRFSGARAAPPPPVITPPPPPPIVEPAPVVEQPAPPPPPPPAPVERGERG